MKRLWFNKLAIIFAGILALNLALLYFSYFKPLTQIIFPNGKAEIYTQNGVEHFMVEIATTPQQLTRGLMYRDELKENEGMLFLFNQEQKITMWMENTRIPLDMLFIDARKQITHIHENAVPHSREFISSQVPVIAVLELAGGATAKRGIRTGDKVRYDAQP